MPIIKRAPKIERAEIKEMLILKGRARVIFCFFVNIKVKIKKALDKSKAKKFM